MSVLQQSPPAASGLREVIETMAGHLEYLEQRGDHRAVFQRVYLLMTREMQRRLAADFFADPEWMERVLVGFARYYFDAVAAYEAGRPCPPAWRVAFDVAAARRAFVLQDALLGINAHINNDLPMVLVDILQADGAWPDARLMLRRRLDHNRINDVLDALIDMAQEELAREYARLIRLVDWVGGRRDEVLAGFILAHCRGTVWHHTELLLDAPGEAERTQLRQRVEQDACGLALKVTAGGRFRLTGSLAPLARRWRLF